MGKMNVKPAKGKALVPWDEEMAELAGQMGDARAAGSGGQFIGTRGAIFSVGGEDIGQEMDVVIIDHCNENQYYDQPFDPDTPAPPVCFAFGRDALKMAPHEGAIDKQNETCNGCQQNAFGSAGKGRKGKACKNVMRLALITEGDLDNIETAEVHYLKVSTTNVARYVELLTKLKNPNLNLGKRPLPCAVVTTMTIKPNKNTQIELGFSIKQAIDDPEHRTALLKKVREQMEKTMFPYVASSTVEEEEAPPKAAKFARKK